MIDEKTVIEEYRQNGFELVDRTKPTIIAQMGFIRLVFAPAAEAAAQPTPKEVRSKFRLW